MAEPANPIYTSRIIKASALIADAKVLLSEWNPNESVSDNLNRARRENILGKASRKRIEDILAIFRQRYLDDADVGTALVTLAQGGASAAWLDPLLYFFAAQNDRTLRDVVVEVVYPRHRAGYNDLPVEVVLRALRAWTAEGKTTAAWGEKTTLRVAQNLMATMRDFGVLQGTKHKQIAPVYLPTPTFALLALWLAQHEGSGDRVLHSDEWKLLFLPVEGVERTFVEADQEHLLTYNAAGSVIRIEFPAANLAEYAHVLLERAG